MHAMLPGIVYLYAKGMRHLTSCTKCGEAHREGLPATETHDTPKHPVTMAVAVATSQEHDILVC